MASGHVEDQRLVRARAIVVEAYQPVWERTGRQPWHVDVASRNILAGRWDRTVEVQAALIALGESQAGTGPTCSPNSEAQASCTRLRERTCRPLGSLRSRRCDTGD